MAVGNDTVECDPKFTHPHNGQEALHKHVETHHNSVSFVSFLRAKESDLKFFSCVFSNRGCYF